MTAIHPATSSKVTIALFTDPELMSRHTCEARARARHLVPDADLRTVEDTVWIGPDAFDTRVWVAFEVGRGGGPGEGRPPIEERPLIGHVFAFGGFLRKCLVFHFSSEVRSGRDESALSDRLALARTRIFGGLVLDPFGDFRQGAGPR